MLMKLHLRLGCGSVDSQTILSPTWRPIRLTNSPLAGCIQERCQASMVLS